MGALAVTNPTLLDLAKATDPDGKIATIVELLAERNEILDDMTWVEGNLTTGHRTTIHTGLPEPTWRSLYQFVQATKGSTAQVTDNTGMLEDYAVVDKALADLASDLAAFRLQEEVAHIEGMNQKVAETLFFGNEGTEPAAFTGLAPRFNSTTAGNGENIITGGAAGGQTDLNSIWFLVWSPLTVHGIVPKNSKAGLQHTDKGLVTLQDGAGGFMEAYQSHYRWDLGLSVRDWRYVVRIPNIDKSALTKDASSGADLPDLMFQAIRRPPNLSMGRPVFYMSRDMVTMLGRQLSSAVKESSLKMENVGGKIITTFQGIRIAQCDVLAADEAAVS